MARPKKRSHSGRSPQSPDPPNASTRQRISSMTRVERLSIGLSLLAIVLSMAAIGIGIWQYGDRKQFDQLERESRLDARVGAVTDGATRFTYHPTSRRVLFRQRFRCILTNNGYAPAGVVDWRVAELVERSPNEVSTGRKGGWYVGMDPELVNAEGQEIVLPIRLEPAESTVFFIEVGMVVPEEAWRAVRSRIPLDKEIGRKTVDSIFTAVQFPHFGQALRVPIPNTGTPPLHTYVDGPEYQEFLAYFVKGNGKQARAQFSLMGNDAYLQQADDEGAPRVD